MRAAKLSFMTTLVAVLLGAPALSEPEAREESPESASSPRLRPYAVTEQREDCASFDPLRQPFFGDTHVHTAYSFDASTQDTFFASQTLSLKLVLPDGRSLVVKKDKQNLLHAFRLSYGMLGVIYEVTMRVRPIRSFLASHRSCSVKQFSAAVEKLSHVDVGMKFYLLPFRNRVYLDLRQYAVEDLATRRIPWKIKDWGESTVLPHVFKSLNRIVPVQGVRYRIIDAFSKATQEIVNNRLVRTGSNSTAQISRSIDAEPLHYSTWIFPAADFAIVVQTYADFCRKIHKETGFRCDMPTVGFRLGRDRSALLSPCFDEPMFALRAVSTQSAGWEDFAIDFAAFAEQWAGVPFFNQTRSLSPEYAHEAFGSRSGFFRRIRRQLDPDNRMMNPFLSQYFL